MHSPKTGTGYALADVTKRDKIKSSSKKKKRSYDASSKTKTTQAGYSTGRWTRLEHFKFLEALKMFGKEWQKVQKHVSTRTSTQARSHAQKFFSKLEKKQLTLEEFLERLDIEQLKLDLKVNDSGNSTEYNEDQPLITISREKNKSSIMNIAMPLELQQQKEVTPSSPGTFKSPEKIVCDDPPSQMLTPDCIMEGEVNDLALNDMNVDDEQQIRNFHISSKRSHMHRKAKTNHAFFSK